MCSTGHCLGRGWLPQLGSAYLTTKLMFMTPPPPPPDPLLPPSPPQGLYEYAKPAWQERPRPKVDEEMVKTFGQNGAPRLLNPAENQLQLYPVTMHGGGRSEGSQVCTCAVCFQVCAGDTHACRDVVVPVRNWPCTLSLLLPSTLLLPPPPPPPPPPPSLSLFCFPCFRWSSLPPLLPLPLSALTVPSRCTSVEPRSVQMHHMPDLS